MGWVREIERPQGSAGGFVDLGQDGLVEVDPAEVLDPFGASHDFEPIRRLTQNGGVEGAAPEVVDRNDRPRLNSFVRRVEDGRRFWFGDHLGIG